MANVTLQRKTAGGWVELLPKTVISQISDISTVGSQLLSLDNPTVVSFLSIDTAGTVSLLDEAALKTALNTVDIDHTHDQSDITDLATTLGNKADLVSGKIKSDQIPDFLFSGMRLISTCGTTDKNTLEELLLLLEGSTDAEQQGGYFVASANFSLTFAAPHTLIGGGDEGETASGLEVEAGDWIVYAGSNQWAIVNNTYRAASSTATGVVKLSTTAAVTRYGLDTNVDDATTVMNESKARQVMKDIHYGTTTPTAVDGDIWFQET